MRQKRTKTITEAYTTTDADCGCRIICSSASDFTITLHTASGRYNFELEIDNIGVGLVSVGGQTIPQNSHAHVGNNGGSAWVVVAGGGSLSLGETDTTAYRGDRGKTAYEHSQSPHANPLAVAPAGGTTGQVLKKSSNTDYAFVWGNPSAAANGVPEGGSAGQVLEKIDGTDFNARWVTPTGGGGSGTGTDVNCVRVLSMGGMV